MKDELFSELCLQYNRTEAEIKSRRRDAPLVSDRKAIATKLRNKGYAFTHIGLIMNRHHTSILYIVKTGEKLEYRKERARKYSEYYRNKIIEARQNAEGNPN